MGEVFFQLLNAISILSITLEKQSVEMFTVNLQHGMESCSAHSKAQFLVLCYESKSYSC